MRQLLPLLFLFASPFSGAGVIVLDELSSPPTPETFHEPDANNPVDLANMGNVLVFGKWTPEQKRSRGIPMLERALRMGVGKAGLDLGLAHELGAAGLTRDESAAARYYAAGSDLRNWDSRARLGLFYREGRGVPKNEALGTRMIFEAADHASVFGDELAGGILLDQPKLGFPRNNPFAVFLLQRAASRGSMIAAAKLQEVYATGKYAGVPANPVRAWAYAFVVGNNLHGEPGQSFRDYCNNLTPNLPLEALTCARELAVDLSRAIEWKNQSSDPLVETDIVIRPEGYKPAGDASVRPIRLK